MIYKEEHSVKQRVDPLHIRAIQRVSGANFSRTSSRWKLLKKVLRESSTIFGLAKKGTAIKRGQRTTSSLLYACQPHGKEP